MAYTSKGERPNVSRKLCNAMRREKRENFDVAAWVQSKNAKDLVMARRGGGQETRDLQKRYNDEKMIQNLAADLFDKYGKNGATWAGCIQAVKTDWVPSFHNKWVKAGKKKS